MIELKPEDILIEYWSSSNSSWINGCRGVKITHLPSKVQVHVDTDRSQHRNKELAINQLKLILENTPNDNINGWNKIAIAQKITSACFIWLNL